jgi:hypothetical protein
MVEGGCGRVFARGVEGVGHSSLFTRGIKLNEDNGLYKI